MTNLLTAKKRTLILDAENGQPMSRWQRLPSALLREGVRVPPVTDVPARLRLQ